MEMKYLIRTCDTDSFDKKCVLTSTLITLTRKELTNIEIIFVCIKKSNFIIHDTGTEKVPLYSSSGCH